MIDSSEYRVAHLALISISWVQESANNAVFFCFNLFNLRLLLLLLMLLILVFFELFVIQGTDIEPRNFSNLWFLNFFVFGSILNSTNDKLLSFVLVGSKVKDRCLNLFYFLLYEFFLFFFVLAENVLAPVVHLVLILGLSLILLNFLLGRWLLE